MPDDKHTYQSLRFNVPTAYRLQIYITQELLCIEIARISKGFEPWRFEITKA